MPTKTQKPFLTAHWHNLLMLNYRVDPSILAPLLPTGTELDLWQGDALVSVVGFQFFDTRLRGVPVPGHRNFEEVNLRFYVRRRASDGWRRGVVFIKEIVPRAAIAWVANRVYQENYVALPMRHQVSIPAAGSLQEGVVRYEWRRGGSWDRMEGRIEGAPIVPEPGSPESFIAEHYWGYASQRLKGGEGTTLEYEVEHPPWRVWTASDVSFDCDVERLYGPDFAPFLKAEPHSGFVAEGSPIAVYRARKL